MRSMAADPQRTASSDADYVERARELGPMIEAAGAEIERCGELPDSVVEELAKRRLFRLLLPRSLGGAELPPAAYVPVVEEVAKHDASVAWCLGQACGCTMTAAYLAPEAAREIFGGPRGIVAWGPPGPAEARIVPGGYRVTGDLELCQRQPSRDLARRPCDGLRRGWRAAPASRRQPGRPHPAVPESARDIDRHLARRSVCAAPAATAIRSPTCSYPRSYAVDAQRRRQAARAGPALRLHQQQLYSAGFAGVALGIARATLDAFVELARDKIPRGAKRTLRDNNVIQAQVAQAEARIVRGARLFAGLARRNLAGGRRHWRGSASSTIRRSGWPRPGPSTRRATLSTRSITPPAQPRSLKTTRSSGGFATSIPWCSSTRAVRPISRP